MELSTERASIEMILNSLKDSPSGCARIEGPRTKGHRMHEKGLLQNLLLQGSPRVQLVQHLAGRSEVWNRFSIVLIDGRSSEFAACIRCGHVLTFRARDGTSGLRKHVCPSRSPLVLKNSNVPDLSERMGMEGTPPSSKMDGGSSYLTCSPLLTGMPGLHEDFMTGAGPSSSSHDPAEGGGAMHGDYEQEDFIDVKAEPVFNVSPEICEDENSQNNTQSSSDRPSSQSSPTPGMAGPYLLKKETHCTTILDQLLRDDTFSDVTLTAEGQSIRAHKIVLCLASAYFRQVLSKESTIQNVIVFRDIKFSELKNLINFIYTGEATVDAAELESFMKTAEMLEVNSLCEGQRNLPKTFLPRREPEQEKPRGSSSKRTHSQADNSSPPTKSRRVNDAPLPSKSSKVACQPSTSSSSSPSSGAPPVAPPPPIIKSEPLSVEDDPVVEEGFPAPDEEDTDFDSHAKSPSQSHDPGSSPRLSDGAAAERNPRGKCPFCPSPQPLRKGAVLTKHVHTCHPDQIFFCCDICSRVFVDKTSFETHKDDCNR